MYVKRSLWFKRLKPDFKVFSFKEHLVCTVGAGLGLFISSCISWWLLGGLNAWYIAPMGASSVLLFAVPSSPLAQPWNVVVGNTIAALVGVSCAYLIQDVTFAFSCAVALSIFLMMLTDALHPPSGAVAMTAVLGGDVVHQLGYAFVFYPVLLNSLLLLAIAMIYNRVVGRHYPVGVYLNTRTQDPTPTQKASIHPQDIQAVLAEQTQLLDISQYDLQKIILGAQEKANRRAVHLYLCQDIMSRDVLSLNEQDSIYQAIENFKKANLMSLPVINASGDLVGSIALYDAMEWVNQHDADPDVWMTALSIVMNRQVVTVHPEQVIQDLIPYFVERSFNYIPVVDQQRLVGIVSRSDMIAAMQIQINRLSNQLFTQQNAHLEDIKKR